ncbi:MAG: polysaccharide pyruvyl transferase family protein [Mycobacterium sp.]
MTRVFLSTWGQSDNIGDSILRRGQLRTFQNIDGAQLHVHVGRKDVDPNSDDYVTAVGLDGTEKQYDTAAGWLLRALRSSAAARTILVMPTGEILLPERFRRYWGWWTLIGALGAKSRGGAMVQVGAGVRMSTVGKSLQDGTRIVREEVDVPPLERIARRNMPVVAWRDANTRNSFQVGDVAPDWAFGEGPDPAIDGLGLPPSERKVLAITMRSDRDVLNEANIGLIREIADRYGLRIQVYSQVRRDGDTMEKLAQILHPGTPAILLRDETHGEWEALMRGMYRESAIVVSDRLHALIIAATEGAIPLAMSNWTTEKAVRMLKPGGFDLPAQDPDAIANYLAQMFADPASVSRRITTARAELDRVRNRLRALVAG